MYWVGADFLHQISAWMVSEPFCLEALGFTEPVFIHHVGYFLISQILIEYCNIIPTADGFVKLDGFVK